MYFQSHGLELFCLESKIYGIKHMSNAIINNRRNSFTEFWNDYYKISYQFKGSFSKTLINSFE